jgi:hypothetical protein
MMPEFFLEGQQAKGIGFELVSIRVSDGVATFTMSLTLGK